MNGNVALSVNSYFWNREWRIKKNHMTTAEQIKKDLSESLRKLFDRPVPDPGKMTSEEIKVEIENCKKRIYQLIDKIDKTNQELEI